MSKDIDDPVALLSDYIRGIKGEAEKVLDPIEKIHSTGRDIPHSTRLSVGHLYLFTYNPATKRKLPYYDTLPLMLMLERKNDGFFGMNLHYLDPRLRTSILNRLVSSRLQENDEFARLRIDYDYLKDKPQYIPLVPCYKYYRFNRVSSKVVEIEFEDWSTVAAMPIEIFRKSSKRRVFADSRKMIREEKKRRGKN
tara:strand:+ start:105 stop:689 length:585 start_codon:yes stop_codon:yes gene_type:complete